MQEKYMIEIKNTFDKAKIVTVLFAGELCVCDIEAVLQLTQSNVSRHLTILKNAGIIKSYKNAQ